MEKTFKVDAIKNGTVIDHITSGKGLLIIELLGLKNWLHPVTLGANFSSQRMGKKDLIKVENKEISTDEVNKIALISPKTTINIIRNYKITKKVKVVIPKMLEDIIQCPNPACVTNHEPVKTRFFFAKNKKTVFRCVYCERYFAQDEIAII